LVSASGTLTGPFGFAGASGYQADSDSGLMLLGHRYYDASIGRFLSRDPAMDGRNWYTHCDNDPLGVVDPDGQIVFLLAAAYFTVGAIIGGVTAIIIYHSDEEKQRLKHEQDLIDAEQRISDLMRDVRQAKGPKRKKPLKEKLDDEIRKWKGHLKEMRQKGWRK
jgi:RHS repeat-associated protein